MEKKNIGYIIGIDEVGRGPLAGPVVVAAVALSKNLRLTRFAKASRQRRGSPQATARRATYNLRLPLRDSKKLTPKQRLEWFKFVKENKIPFAIANVWPKTIDKINISKAANLAATKALKKLTTNNLRPTTRNYKILLDGGLYLNELGIRNYELRNKTKTIIKGDEKIPAIALASIVAKVHRDKYMEKMHKKYPKYFFDKHKGYGTKLHFQKIKKFGISKIHRKSFLKIKTSL